MDNKALVAAYKGKLASSKLTAADGLRLALEPTLAGEMSALGYKPFAGMRIPYFDWSGNVIDFERVRYLEDTRTGFDKLTKSKERRYDQLADTGIEVYLPPLMKEAWGLVLRDPSRTIVITEGELKAACATRHGVPCVGLGGVWNFLNPEDKLELIPQLENAKWDEREVVICFDSDAASNIQVVRAENRLAKYLLARGAIVFIVRLPNVYDEASGKKTGIDDYILVKGVEEFERLIEDERDEFSQSKAFHELNEEVVLVRSEKTIVEIKTMQRMNMTEFTKLLYAPRKYMGVNADNDPVPKPLAPAWLEWEGRRELLRTTYKPGAGPEVDGELNTWLAWGCTPIPGDVKPWRDLVDFIFSSDPARSEEYITWFERWCAYPLQHPGAKLHNAVLMVGPQGVGKTLTADILAKIYGENSTSVNNKHFSTDHNTWAERKQFVIGNEVSSSEDRRDLADQLKEMISREVVRVNPKFINEYELPDCINYYLTSNHPHALMLEDDDRRYFVHRTPSLKQPDSFYARIKVWKNGSGPSHLFHYLLNLDLGDFNPDSAPPITVSRMEMQSHGRSPVADWCYTAKNDPDSILRAGKTVKDYTLWSIEELFALFVDQRLGGQPGRYTPNILSRELRSAGLTPANNHMPVRTEGGQKRLWIMRDAPKLATRSGSELGEEYDRERSTDKVLKKRVKFS